MATQFKGLAINYFLKMEGKNQLIQLIRVAIILILITNFPLSACALSTSQITEAPSIPTFTSSPSPLPTQTPEPTATITPIPDPYRIQAGYLERWDGSTYQPIGQASSFAVDEARGWVIAHDPAGLPVAVYDETTGTSASVIDGTVVLGNLPYRFNPDSQVNPESQIWTLQVFVLNGGRLQTWSKDKLKFETYRTSTQNEPLFVDLLVPLEPGAHVAVDEGKIVASLQESDIKVVEISNGIAVRSDGWPMVWDQTNNQLVDYLQLKEGLVYTLDNGQLQVVKAPDGTQVQATEIKPTSLGYALIDGSGTLTMLIDKAGNRLPANMGQLPLGWQVYSYDAASQELVQSPDNYFDYLVNSYDTLKPNQASLWPISLTLVEPALNGNWDMRWQDPASFTRFWLEVALARNKATGTVDQNMSYVQFVEQVKANGSVTLKDLSAWNPATGQVETTDAQVREIKIIITGMDQKQRGVPALPMNEGKTRYATDRVEMWGRDVVFEAETGVLYLVTEINSEISLNKMSFEVSRAVGGLGILVNTPSKQLASNVAGVSNSGRTFFRDEIFTYAGLFDTYLGYRTTLVVTPARK